MRRTGILAAFAAGAFILAAAGCGSTSPPDAPTVGAPTAIQATVEAPAPTTESTTAPAKTAAAVVLVKMPNAVGMVLQDAQDLMQKLTGNPVYITESHDVRFTRLQILDRDWKVCTQNVKKGTKFNPDRTHIDFGVVKLTEKCP